jgi:PAS domain S-box-containing protein
MTPHLESRPPALLPTFAPEYFEAIVTIAAEAVISIDESQRIVLFNPAAEAMFGYAASEVLNGPLQILLPEEVHRSHGKHVRRFMTSGSTARLMNNRRPVQGRRKNGELFPAEASISRVVVDGRPLVSAVVRDVTERVQLDATARRATALRDEMLAIVSHDLRNPLAAISTALALLEDSPEPTGQRRMKLLRIARESSEWMDRMIRDLLDIASIDSGRLSIERQSVDAVILLVRAHALFEPMFTAKRIQFTLDVPERLPRIELDEDRILQLIGNLLSNAAKFTGPKGRVTLSARHTGAELIVTVQDTGPGIRRADLPHVFDRFWHGRQTVPVGGTGLGLSIAKGIVDTHGGRIWVDTEEGIGSRFSFSLPSPIGDADGSAK